MRLTFQKPYKSIGHFPSLELPDFVVLTGVNGAGKSHLLEAIESGAVQIDDLEQTKTTTPIRRFDWTNLVPQDTGAFAAYQITQERQQLWTQLNQSVNQAREQVVNELRASNRPELLTLSPKELLDLKLPEIEAFGATREEASAILQRIQQVVTGANQNAISQFVRSEPRHRPRFVELVQTSPTDPLIAWKEDDFYDRFPRSWQSIDMFQQSFGRLFADYQRNWLNNALKRLGSTEDSSVTFLTDTEFVREYGEAPWDFVNEILTTAGLDFRINRPPKHEDRPYEPVLTDHVTGSQVKFTDLSSGEKVLMSFAFCLYYAQDRRQLVDYPKVLLFDEIDAPLHPSMTQSLLRTIQEVLLDRHKIKVILTTHSPSTAALSSEGAVYAMYKTGIRIRKATKDKALSLLTAGVPTLSINYENRRQVFVESRHDVGYYEKIYEKLRPRLVSEISLTFIASGKASQGNSDQVKEVVNKLSNGGSRSVYGIIDWDLTNTGNERVKVLGCGVRYSIENFVLDPVLIGAFLLREKFLRREDLRLTEHETFLSVSSLERERLQSVADFIVEKIKAQFPSPQSTSNLKCKYVGGQEVELPTWFLNTQGHKLEQALKDAFPPLRRFATEADLKNTVLAKVVDDVPELIPEEFLLLFQSIQNFPDRSPTQNSQ